MTTSPYPQAPTILGTLTIDRDSKVPLYRQIFEAIRLSILNGQLRLGTRLPSTRDLATDIHVGRNTVVTAYEQLVAEGYAEPTVGSGTRVVGIPPEMISRTKRTVASEVTKHSRNVNLSKRGKLLADIERTAADPTQTAFQPGLPALDEFPFALWSRLVARRISKPFTDTLGYYHIGGYPLLRKTIADYLGTARGVICSADQIIVVTGAQAALDLSARMLTDPGDSVWIEDPGYLGARGALSAAGARLCAVPVDHEGINVSFAERKHPAARLAYVTPSYQYPLGVTMSLQRRLQLLDWAHKNRAWILEDDYDSEYRYRGYPLTALHGLDQRERVVYMGTFSKTMFPALRLAYLVVPESLADAFRRAIRHTGHEAPIIEQVALTDFIAEGYYASHLRRMRKLYAARQQLFVELLQDHLGDHLDVKATDAGMQLVAYLTNGLSESKIIDNAKQRGLHISGLSAYYLRKPRRRGLYLGYAGVAESTMHQGVINLAAGIVDTPANT